jgi:hypothetical protein
MRFGMEQDQDATEVDGRTEEVRYLIGGNNLTMEAETKIVSGTYCMEHSEDPDVFKLIANFLAVSAPLEKYLQEGRPLTNLQLEFITLTVDQLQTFLDIWNKRQG